jgi:peptidoglycan/xylan/chitin deacetylase (PgdA/CDA1 family)
MLNLNSRLIMGFQLLLLNYNLSFYQLLSFTNIRLIIIIVLASYLIKGYSQQDNDVKAKIATWYGNKPGAVSVTFDDGGYSQFVSAYPILEKYRIKGTFSLVGEWVEEAPSYSSEPGDFGIMKMGWPQFTELYEHGHELSAHGYYHQRYDKYRAVSDLAAEMIQIKSLIESRIPCKVYTLHYPYSYASENIPPAAKEAGFLFGRTGLDTINSSTPSDMFLLSSQAVLNSDVPGEAGFQQWIAEARGNWLILMYHHFFTYESKEAAILRSHNVENTYSILPEEFDKQMDYLVASGYWIAPVCEIGRYITQRENTEIRTSSSKRKILVYTVTNLDKTVYDRPLTLEVHIPWKKARVKGSLDDGIKETENGVIYIDVFPENEVVITKE